MPETKKTDNSYFEEKIKLRESLLPDGPLKILDAYAGSGSIWKHIGKKRGIARYTAIEKEKGKNPRAICLDNSKILPRLDLSDYNVIDLDAYGIPSSQLISILENRTLKPQTAVYVTCITYAQGTIPHEIAKYINCTPTMFQKCRGLFKDSIFDAIKALLFKHGIKEISYYEHKGSMHKLYIGFMT